MKTFCEIIRELREDRDLKQADVAKVLGTSQQYYSKYETGKYEMPIHCVTALADFMAFLLITSLAVRSTAFVPTITSGQLLEAIPQTQCLLIYFLLMSTGAKRCEIISRFRKRQVENECCSSTRGCPHSFLCTNPSDRVSPSGRSILGPSWVQ